MLKLKFRIGAKMTSNMFHAINIPKTSMFGCEQSLRYFMAAWPCRKNSMMPVPSNGGSGMRLKQNKTRFSENIMLSRTDRPLTIPAVGASMTHEKAK